MKTPSSAFRSVRHLLPAAAPLLLALALALPGCATRQQVAEIVTRSNAAMLAGQFGLPAPGSSASNLSWQAESARIDAFITAHPDQKATTAPLRVRQAILLLANGQTALAQAAFNEAQIGDLHTDRDKALKRSELTLIWWFPNSTKKNWDNDDHSQAQASLKALQKEQASLASSPEIRDYLAEMRAWIGLSAARQNSSDEKQLLENALDVYAEIFTADDLVILLTGHEQLPDPKAFGPDVRRRLRAKVVLAHAKQMNKDDSLGAHPKNPTFDQLLNKP